MVRHIVLFSLGDEAGEQGRDLLDSLAALPERVEQIESLALGPLLNPGGHGYALTVDVADREALDAYRAHPDHRPVAERLRELATDVVVADIEL